MTTNPGRHSTHSQPFSLDEGEAPPRVVSWLRLVEDVDGVQAALFQTTEDGEPLDFNFTHGSLRQYVEHGEEAKAASALIGKLMPSGDSSPALILGLSDEIPVNEANETLVSGIPLGLVKALPELMHVQTEGEEGVDVRWLGVHHSRQLELKELFDEVMGLEDPLEPFRRAGDALAEAFSDEHVLALTKASDLSAVVNLHSMPRNENLSEKTSAPAVTAPQPTNGAPAHPQTLAQRLWAILRASPARRRVIQLDWAGDLMPFQQDGVQALISNRRLLLADDMGLGKTIQAIIAIRFLRAQRKISSCIVAAPASLLDQWRREIDKWAPELSAIIIRGSAADREWQWKANQDVTLISYDALRSDFFGDLSGPARTKTWDVVVADEAQRIKNRNDSSVALKGLRRRRSWALTGTPVENDEEELASIMEFVDHGDDGDQKRFHAGWQLRERHRELQLRRKKSDVLQDLPPKLETKIPIDLGSEQRRSYDKAEQDGIVYLKSLGGDINVRHVLELITRLKQICNADPKTGESSKLDDISQRLEQLSGQGHKALIFSQYTSDHAGVAAAARHLQRFSPLTITGEVHTEDRDNIIRQFRNRVEHKALILSLRAGGLGLNLQEASYVFHLDRWWNPAIERQAEDRSHRLGQTVKVNVIKYSCVDTIEERIDRILEGKQQTFDRLVDDVSLDLSAQMNSQELFSLFGLN